MVEENENESPGEGEETPDEGEVTNPVGSEAPSLEEGDETPDEDGEETPDESDDFGENSEAEEDDFDEEEDEWQRGRDPGSTFDVSKSVNAPRKTHGTRVAFTFECAGCKKEATLDYKPKGVPVERLLCEECMSSEDAAGRWKLVRTKKEWEERSRTFELVCSECGHIEYSRHPPRKGKAHVCERCLMEQAQPDKSRLEGAAKVEGGVMMRKKKKKD